MNALPQVTHGGSMRYVIKRKNNSSISNELNLLLENEKKEVDVISAFLPKQLSEDETKKICADTIKSTGAESIKDMGKVMGHLKSKYSDALDFSKVNLIIKELLK